MRAAFFVASLITIFAGLAGDVGTMTASVFAQFALAAAAVIASSR